MSVALYIRVSTLDQNPDAQRHELEAYADRHQWPLPEMYEDHASGADTKRPALTRLLEGVRHGRIDTVVVWKLDRLGRSVLHLHELLNEFDIRLVRFISTTEAIDTGAKWDAPMARFFLHILAAMAELERSLIRERVVSGLARYQRDWNDGKVGKTVHSRSGKDLPPHRQPGLIDIRRVLELRGTGMSFTKIAAELNIPRSTILLRLKTMRQKG